MSEEAVGRMESKVNYQEAIMYREKGSLTAL